MKSPSKKILRFVSNRLPVGFVLFTFAFIAGALFFLAIPDSKAKSAVYSYFTLTFSDVEKDGTWTVSNFLVPTNIHISPDNKYVYATASGSNALIMFARDENTGRLLQKQSYLNGTSGITGLSEVFDVTLSRDGLNAYVTGFQDNTIVVFSRDRATGELTFLELHKDNLAGVEGLQGIKDISISPDGKNVYTTGMEDDAISVFDRNLYTGKLNFSQVLVDNTLGIDGLDGITDVELSPDGKYVYTAGSIDDAVSIFSRNSQTGALTYIQSHKEGVSGLNTLDGANDIEISPDGKYVYLAAANDDTVSTFLRNESTGNITFISAQTDGLLSVDGLDGVMDLTMSPDNLHVYASSLNDNSIAAFRISSIDGSLIYINSWIDGNASVDGLKFAVSSEITSDGKHLYVVGKGDNSVAEFARNPATGELVYINKSTNNFQGVDGINQVSDLALLPNKSILYSASPSENKIGIFDVNSTSSVLTYIGRVKNNEGSVTLLEGVDSLETDSNGQFLYAASSKSSAITVFKVTSATGTLTHIAQYHDGTEGVDGLKDVSDLEISPDQNFLYAAGYGEDSVSVFSRNATSGVLTFIKSYKEIPDSMDGISGPASLSIAPDGKHLYSANWLDNSVASFEIDTDTGLLTYIGYLTDANYGGNVIWSPSDIEVSPDGKHVYMTSATSDTLSVFKRDSNTGYIYLIGFLRDNNSGINGLDWPSSLSITSDGKYIIVAAAEDHTVTVFKRDTSTGYITIVGYLEDGSLGVDGLKGASSVEISSDNSLIYISGKKENSIAAFLGQELSLLYTPYPTQPAIVPTATPEPTPPPTTTKMDNNEFKLRSFDKEKTTAHIIHPNERSTLDTVNHSTKLLVEKLNHSTSFQMLLSLDNSKCFQRPDTGITLRCISINSYDYLGNPIKDVNLWSPSILSTTLTQDDLNLIGGLDKSQIEAISGRLKYQGFDKRRPGMEWIDVHTTYSLNRPTNGLNSPVNMLVTKDGSKVLVSSSDPPTLSVFGREPSSGTVSYIGTKSLGNLSSNQNIWVSEYGSKGELSAPSEEGVISIYNHSTSPGLTKIESTISDLKMLMDEVKVSFTKIPETDRSILILKNGTIYILEHGDHVSEVKTLFTYNFSMDETSLINVSNTLLSSDGRYLYLTSEESNYIYVYRISDDKDFLTYTGKINESLGVLSSIKITPDGNHLYAASKDKSRLSGFTRNPYDGSLSLIGYVEDNVYGVDGLQGIMDLSISPDGNHIYAAAHSENSLSAFVRNHESGALKYIGYVKNGIGRVKGIEGINSVAISPDGNQVYVTAQESRSLVTFNRQKNGVITFHNQVTESDSGNSGVIIKAPLIRKPGIYGLNWYPNTESLENTEYKMPSVGGAKLSFNLTLLFILSGTTLMAFSALIIYRVTRYNIQNK